MANTGIVEILCVAFGGGGGGLLKMLSGKKQNVRALRMLVEELLGSVCGVQTHREERRERKGRKGILNT